MSLTPWATAQDVYFFCNFFDGPYIFAKSRKININFFNAAVWEAAGPS
jgi:hypothetical protein